MDKQKAIEVIHNLGGCDAPDEWSKGYDAGITDALNAIEEMPDNTANKLLFTDKEKYEAYKATGINYDGKCSACSACIFDTDIFCAECGARLDGEQDD